MSMLEFRNMSAKCIEPSSDKVYELHEVSFEYKDSGVWVSKSVQLLALDPKDAIKYVKGANGGYTS